MVGGKQTDDGPSHIERKRHAPSGHAFHTNSFTLPTVVSGSNDIVRLRPDTRRNVRWVWGVWGTDSCGDAGNEGGVGSEGDSSDGCSGAVESEGGNWAGWIGSQRGLLGRRLVWFTFVLLFVK